MQDREQYRQMHQAQVDAWALKLAAIKAKAAEFTAQAALASEAHTEALHRRILDSRATFDVLSRANSGPWTELKAAAAKSRSARNVATEKTSVPDADALGSDIEE